MSQQIDSQYSDSSRYVTQTPNPSPEQSQNVAEDNNDDMNDDIMMTPMAQPQMEPQGTLNNMDMVNTINPIDVPIPPGLNTFSQHMPGTSTQHLRTIINPFTNNYEDKKLEKQIHECPVCMECKWVLQLSCFHFICLNCIPRLEKEECPSCRTPITGLPTDSIHPAYISIPYYISFKDYIHEAIDKYYNHIIMRRLSIKPHIRLRLYKDDNTFDNDILNIENKLHTVVMKGSVQVKYPCFVVDGENYYELDLNNNRRRDPNKYIVSSRMENPTYLDLAIAANKIIPKYREYTEIVQYLEGIKIDYGALYFDIELEYS